MSGDKPRDAIETSGSEFSFDYVRPLGNTTRFIGRLLHADDRVLVFSQTVHVSRPLVRRGATVLDDGYSAVWFLFQGRPFDVARFYDRDGIWTGYYVDILEPVYWTVGPAPVLTPLVDLALDVWIAPDGTHEVLDEDEFEAFQRAGAFSAEQATHARSALAMLLREIVAGLFPPPLVRDFDIHPSE